VGEEKGNSTHRRCERKKSFHKSFVDWEGLEFPEGSWGSMEKREKGRKSPPPVDVHEEDPEEISNIGGGTILVY